MEINKITDNLKRLLQTTEPDNEIEVVIELNKKTTTSFSDNMGRHEKITNLKTSFNNDLQPVVTEILKLGGNIIDSGWLNQTIKVKMPAKNIEELSRLKEINAIDIAHFIMKD